MVPPLAIVGAVALAAAAGAVASAGPVPNPGSLVSSLTAEIYVVLAGLVVLPLALTRSGWAWRCCHLLARPCRSPSAPVPRARSSRPCCIAACSSASGSRELSVAQAGHRQIASQCAGPGADPRVDRGVPLCNVARHRWSRSGQFRRGPAWGAGRRDRFGRGVAAGAERRSDPRWMQVATWSLIAVSVHRSLHSTFT